LFYCEMKTMLSLIISVLCVIRKKLLLMIYKHFIRGAQIPGARSLATRFCVVAPNICGSSVWNLLHITVLVPRILSWLPDFWKICALLHYMIGYNTLYFLLLLKCIIKGYLFRCWNSKWDLLLETIKIRTLVHFCLEVKMDIIYDFIAEIFHFSIGCSD